MLPALFQVPLQAFLRSLALAFARRACPGGLLLLLALCCSAALAAPAPWYHWRSKIDGTVLCRQTSPGSGWEQSSGPFDNPECRPPARRAARLWPQ